MTTFLSLTGGIKFPLLCDANNNIKFSPFNWLLINAGNHLPGWTSGAEYIFSKYWKEARQHHSFRQLLPYLPSTLALSLQESQDSTFSNALRVRSKTVGMFLDSLTAALHFSLSSLMPSISRNTLTYGRKRTQ